MVTSDFRAEAQRYYGWTPFDNGFDKLMHTAVPPPIMRALSLQMNAQGYDTYLGIFIPFLRAVEGVWWADFTSVMRLAQC